MKTKKKHETTHDSFTQRAWGLSSLDRLCMQDGTAPIVSVVQGCKTASNRRIQASASSALSTRSANSTNTEFSAFSASRTEFCRQTRNLAAVLHTNHVERSSIILCDSVMRPEIFILQTAAMKLGACVEFLPSDMRFRDKQSCFAAHIRDAQPAIIAVDTPEHAKLWIDACAPEISQILCMERTSADGTPAERFLADSDGMMPECYAEFAQICASDNAPDTDTAPVLIDTNAAAFYCYTQGSHGAMRRVSMPHSHLRDQAQDLVDIFGLTPSSVIAFDLASVHSAGLSIFAACLLSGAQICLTRDISAISEAIQHHGITHLFAMPHSLQALRQRIIAPITAPIPAQKLRSLNMRLAKFRKRSASPILGSVIRSLCLTPIVKAYFPHLSAVISYGNHFDSKIGEFFSFLDIPIYNAFTMAELGFVHIHDFNGSGSFLKSAEARIRNGCLWVKPQHAAVPLINTHDFVFEDARCGLCSHHVLSIRLESGQIIDPLPIRDNLRRCPLIDDVMIFGEGRPFLTALVYLRADEAQKWAEAQHLPQISFDILSQDSRMYSHICDIVKACSNMRGTHESIEKFAIIDRTMQADPYILTPCLLTRVSEAAQRYSAIIESFYKDNF